LNEHERVSGRTVKGMWRRLLEYRYPYQYCGGIWYSCLQITKNDKDVHVYPENVVSIFF